MSTDIELLPSSVAAFTEALKGERGSLDAWLEVNNEADVRLHVEAYARANVAHATAEKDAEIEALRADRDSFQQQAEHNLLLVERLAEALHKLEDSCEDSDDAQYGTRAVIHDP